MERLATQAIRTLLLHRQPRRREDQKSLQRTQHGPHTTRKGTNGHVTLYIMYINAISLGSSQFRIRVSIKLHLQCHLSISCSHCTALPIPLQYHSPRTTVPPPYSQHCPQCVDNILVVFLGHSGGSPQAPMWLHVQGNLSKILSTQTSLFYSDSSLYV